MMRWLRFLLMYRILILEIAEGAFREGRLLSEREAWVEIQTQVALLHKLTPPAMRPHVGRWLEEFATHQPTTPRYIRMMKMAAEHYRVCSNIERISKDAGARLREAGLVK
jgi:hypothetical protein